MNYTLLDQLYEYYRQCQGVTSQVDEVRPGNLFVAVQKVRPAQPFLRWLWTTLESLSPALLYAIVGLAIRLRIFNYITIEKVEGNGYAARALEHGAAYAVIDNAVYQRGPRYLLVKDVGDTLAELAERHRHELPIPLVAITGSVGKTTTKELVHRVLGAHFAVTATEGNANSRPGVSRTVLSIQPQHALAVTEMGIVRPGELAEMCRVAQPTCGLITSIGKAHLRELKNLDGVQAAKGELFDYLRAHGGHIFLNLDDPRVVAAAQRYTDVTTYGKAAEAVVRGEVLSAEPYVRVRCYLPSTDQPVDIQTRMAGTYNLYNVLAALTVGGHFAVPVEKMVAAIEAYQPVENRSQVIVSGTNHIILDAYNANPTSMTAALENFRQLSATTKILILGDMWDLGQESERAHRSILELAQTLKPTQVVFIGKQFMRVRQPDFGLYFKNVDEARRWYVASRFENAYILIKGAGRFRLKNLLG